MCVIVDANVASEVFRHRRPDFGPLLKWVEDQGGKLIVGGQLATELAKIGMVRAYLEELVRAGIAIRKSDSAIVAEESVVSGTRLCRSDDPHVIALARVSGARILCSRDKKLHADFKNMHLVKPKGRVYQNRGHARVLHHDPCCAKP